MRGEELRVKLYKELVLFYGKANVDTRKRTATDRGDNFDPSIMYNPELDILIYPSNTSQNLTSNNKSINEAFKKNQEILDEINGLAIQKYIDEEFNKNPRFFLAIEVEGNMNPKHILGEMINASILGKIGIIAGTDSEIIKKCKKIYQYIAYARDVKKANIYLGNLIIIEGEKLLNFFIKKNNH